MKAFMNKIALPFIIIVVGAAVAVYLKNRAAEAKHQAPPPPTPAVEIVRAIPQTVDANLMATGTVKPARQVTLTSEVAGRVIKLTDLLVPGTRLKRGKLIARIDQRDYRLAIKQEESRVHQAELELKLEASRGAVAAEEWQLLGGAFGSIDDPNQLALRKPQYEVAQRQTESAKSGLQRAQLNLNRTEIRAPFNAIVLDKLVDVGQLVGPTTPITNLMGTDELWVEVSVPVDQLPSIQIPGINAETGSKAVVTQRIGPDNTVVRTGEVIRLHGQLDSQNRTGKVLVSIQNPFDVEDAGLPLLAGAYVEVEITGNPISNAFRLPRSALQEGAFVWTIDSDEKLVRSEVTVGWRDRESVVITSGLSPDDRVVTSLMSFPLEGMQVKTLEASE